MKKIKIGNKTIGDGVYIIAEAGVNHLNNLERAKELIIKAAQAGADAIKFQTYTADELVVKGTPKFWKSEGSDVEGTQYDAYNKLGNFPKEYYPEIFKTCQENNIEFLSTPFSFEAADFLHQLGMKAFKVASSDMSHLPYLKHIAKFQKPILLSTGASTLGEIEEAVSAIKSEGNDKIIILHCTLCYPTKNEDANLAVISTLKTVFPQYPIGISDHTLGVFPSVIAAASGACVIEKHYTTDKTLPDSADHWLSVDPVELKAIVEQTRQLEALRGSGEKRILDCEKETRKLDKRSIVTKQTIPRGTIITREMLTFKRPGTGIPPKHVDIVVGRQAQMNLKVDTTIKWKHI
jgi:N,N'-diacetyllegionaminate synthase